MTVVQFRPVRPTDRIGRELARAIDARPGATPARAAGQWSPAIDVAETETEFVLRAELPGMRQEDIDIELSGDTLVVRGERRFESEERKDQFVRVERSYGRFERSYTVATPLNHSQVRASYRDGILEITLPKSEDARPRRVPVTTE